MISGLSRAETPYFLEGIALFTGAENCHHFPMANFKHLRDLYQFPGFVPRDRIRGVFRDPMAVVIPLHRCRKKRSVASAAKRTSATTTNGGGVSATFPAAIGGSISPSLFEGCTARGARP